VRTTIDTLIATFCIVEGHELLHCDRDFDPFERYLGLRVLKA
jgi:predicted nucleic acid-binding protein